MSPIRPAVRGVSEKRIAERFTVTVDALVRAGTIGTGAQHDFHTVNISETGMLLRCDQKVLHLNASSILELYLYPDNDKKENPIFLFVRWVRQQDEFSIGVQIADVDDDNTRRYAAFLENAKKSVVPFEDPSNVGSIKS